MIIESIEICNYRQYEHAKLFLSPPDDGKFVTAIVGMSGAGKTNILNALTWCLYGKELHLSDQDQLLPIYNIPALIDTDNESIFEIKVEIIFKNYNGERILVSRDQKYKRTSGGEKAKKITTGANAPDGSHVVYMVAKKGKNFEPYENPELLCTNIIPEDLEQYFLFDGEKIRDFFKSDKARQAMKIEVDNLSQIGLIDRVKRRLIARRDELNNGVKSESEQLTNAKNEFTTSKQVFEAEKEEYRRLEGSKKQYEETISSIRAALKGCTEENVANLQTEKEDLEGRINQIESDIEKKEDEKNELLVHYTPLILIKPCIDEVERDISLREDAGDIPAEFKRSFLQKRLDEKKCICGEPLDTSAEGRNRCRSISDLLNQANKINDYSESIIRFGGELKRIDYEISRFWSLLKTFNDDLRKLDDRKKQLDETLKAVSKKLDGINVESVKELQNQEKEAETRLLETRDKMAVTKRNIEDYKTTFEKKDQEYKELLAKTAEGNKLVKKIAFIDQAIKASDEIITQTTDEVRKEVSDLTNKFFFSFLAKKTTYKDVSITSDYEVNVIHSLGWQARGSLSTGETQMLALAFFAALNRVSGLDGPIFIDAPLTRISEAPTENIVATFPEAFNGKQVCLLMLDKEYKDIKNQLAPIVGAEYLIDWIEIDNNYGKSEILVTKGG